MAEKPFRVLLDLTDLQLESLKYVWMNVSPQEIKTISDFKTSILYKISLERSDIHLFVRNGILLDNETIMILREDDIVKVNFPSQTSSIYNSRGNSVKECKKSSRKRNLSESSADLTSSAKRSNLGHKVFIKKNEDINVKEKNYKEKKHKKCQTVCSEIPLNHSTTLEINDCWNEKKISKKKDRKQKTLETCVNNLPERNENFCSFKIQDSESDVTRNNTFEKGMNNESSCHVKLNSTKDLSSVNNLTLESENGLDAKIVNNVSEPTERNNCPKKKRKRRKKKKNVAETTVMDTCDESNVNNEFKSFANNTNESTQRKHIIYSSSLSDEQTPENKKSDCDKKEEKFSKTDTFVLNESTSNALLKPPSHHPKISTPAQSEFYKNPKLSFLSVKKMNISSDSNNTNDQVEKRNKSFNQMNPCTNLDISNRSQTTNLNSSVESQKNSLDVSNQTHIKSENPTKARYEDLPFLNSRPAVGTHIAYKVLELDAHYSPVISDYREGIIKNINDENDEMEIELLKHEIKPAKTGKFENLKEDEIPLPEIKTSDSVCWSALIEPKLLTY